jgi:hypothetical protein
MALTLEVLKEVSDCFALVLEEEGLVCLRLARGD